MEPSKSLTGTKEELYQQLLPQIQSVVSDERNHVANMANIVAALKQSFSHYSWVGFYLFDAGTNELVLGPFQGKIACTRITIGKGVCGTSFQKKETVIVPDVNAFPGHIFCDADSLSEIVVPVFYNHTIIGVLDVDSHDFSSFDTIDQYYLEQLIRNISGKIVQE